MLLNITDILIILAILIISNAIVWIIIWNEKEVITKLYNAIIKNIFFIGICCFFGLMLFARLASYIMIEVFGLFGGNGI